MQRRLGDLTALRNTGELFKCLYHQISLVGPSRPITHHFIDVFRTEGNLRASICHLGWRLFNLLKKNTMSWKRWAASGTAAFSSPERTILLACGRDRELWLAPNQEVRESRTSGSSTQTQKSETTVVANGYKNAPSLRLHIFLNWPELSIPACRRIVGSGDENGTAVCREERCMTTLKTAAGETTRQSKQNLINDQKKKKKSRQEIVGPRSCMAIATTYGQ